MDQMAIIGAVQSLAGLKRVLSAFESPGKNILVLPTMVNAATNGSKETMTALQEDPDLAQFLIPIVIRQDVKLSYAAASKRSIWEYDARTRAAEDYTRLVDYFLDMVANESEKDGIAAAKS
jgi:cellulose biosynthesis protein BcsQ